MNQEAAFDKPSHLSAPGARSPTIEQSLTLIAEALQRVEAAIQGHADCC